MGWIVPTESGTYRVNWRDGTGRQRAKTFNLKREAKAFLAQVDTDTARGVYVDPHAGRKIRLQDFTVEWFAGRNVEATTEYRTLSVLRTHVLPRWGEWPLSSIDHPNVQRWARDLCAVRARATAAKCVGTLSLILDAAVRARLIAFNPCDQVQLPSAHRSRTEMLTITREELTRKLLPAVAPKHRGLVAAAALAGLRWGEAAGLPWRAVDLEGAELRVRQVAVEVSGRIEVRDYPKSRAGVRTIPLPTVLLGLLRERRAVADPSQQLVFPDRLGSPMRRSNFRRRVWVPAVERSGLPPKLRFHDLRHSYATWLVTAGMPINVVQRLLGHEQASTTLNLYVHAPRDYDDRVRGALEDTDETPIKGAADFLLTDEDFGDD